MVPQVTEYCPQLLGPHNSILASQQWQRFLNKLQYFTTDPGVHRIQRTKPSLNENVQSDVGDQLNMILFGSTS